MISVIERLFENDYAYRAGDNIYFSVGKFRDYGKLSATSRKDSWRAFEQRWTR